MSFNCLYTLIIVFLCLVSCQQNNSIHDDDGLKKITKEIRLSSFKKLDKISLISTGQSGYFMSLMIIDTFLVCTDYRSPQVLQIFGTGSYNLVGQIITRGNGYGQCLGVANILPANSKNLFWLYDITLGKFLKIDIQNALKEPDVYRGEEEIILRDSAKRLKSPCWVNDSVFVAGSYSRDDCRFVYVNKESGIVNKAGRLPTPKKGWPEENGNSMFNILATIYTVNLVKHPDKELFLAAYNKTDRLELYGQGKLKKIIKGPDFFDPIISFKKVGKVFDAIETPETLFSYTSIYATSGFIYALYSGKNNYNTCSQKLMVFNWSGDPVRIIEFDRMICSFTISENEKETLIYTIEKETGNTCVAKL